MSAGDTVKIKLDAGGFKVGVIVKITNDERGAVYHVRYTSDSWGVTTGIFRAARLESCSP